jgi:hypothetical protein
MAVKPGEYPEMRLLTAFLAVCLSDLCQQLPPHERDQELVLAAAVLAKMSEWMLAVERCPRLMTVQLAANVDRVCWELPAPVIYKVFL